MAQKSTSPVAEDTSLDNSKIEDKTKENKDVGHTSHKLSRPISSFLTHSSAQQSPRGLWAAIYIISASLSLFARLIGIGFSDKGNTPVFDEKHYAPQAFQMLFIPGHQESFPGYGLVVHPPLGKTLISFGEKIFGYTPLGWRAASIVAGVLIVLMLMRIIHIITGNMTAVIFTAIIANMEGTQLFMSRIAMLDVFMAFFITAMAFCIVKDITTDTTYTPWHKRGWLLLSGVCAGLAMAVKLSGAFYAAFMGVALVVIVACTSKSIRETLKALGMGLIFYLVVPLTIFLLSWVPWFANENSVYRHVAESGDIEHPLPEWIANILPDSLNSFASYQIGVAQFHTGLKSGPGIDNFHPWESKPELWFLGARPMLFLNTPADKEDVVFGSGAGEAKLMLCANMAVWVLIIPVILWGIYKVIAKKNPEWFIIISGFAIGIIPWFITHDRQQYFFYTVSWSMFIILGISLMFYEIAQIIHKKTKLSYQSSLNVMYIPYAVIVAVVFVIYLPWLYNIPASDAYHNGLTLLSSWNQFEGYQ